VNKARCKTAVHLCFGNFGGQRIQRGSYEQLVAFFNALKCDHLVLETTRRDWQEVLMLRDVKAELTFGFGVIDVKDLQVESAPLVAERIEKLVNTFGIDRVQFVNPDCGLSHLPRDVAERKLRVLTEGRNLFLGACEDR
jgi:5-methyltetrahydropteroyltriglutamate--homocysteine methyltransferase